MESVLSYLMKAAGAWFLGFFPLAEIYVAVPAAVASGLDDISVIFWTVFGNFTPILLIIAFYEWITHYDKIQNWLDSLISEKVKDRINRWGIWFVLLGTPMTGVWVMAVTAKTLGMESKRFLLVSLVSILFYALVILVLIRLGIDRFS